MSMSRGSNKFRPEILVIDSDMAEVLWITDVRICELGGLEFCLQCESGDIIWQDKHLLLGFGYLVREFYIREQARNGKSTIDARLSMPSEFAIGDIEISNAERIQTTRITEATFWLTIQHNGVRDEDPQYYDSEQESDSDELNKSQEKVHKDQAT